MKKKKLACILLGGLFLMGSLAGCGNENTLSGKNTGNTKGQQEVEENRESAANKQSSIGGKDAADQEGTDRESSDQKAAAELFEISVVSREDGSGTRGAFIELFGVQEKDADGNKVDYTTEEAVIGNSTEIMMTTVAGDKNAVGYVSLGSLNDTVKAVKIDGTAPGVEAIKDGSYTISRPFNIAVKGELSKAAQDFMNYMMSEEGQAVVEENGYIAVQHTGAFESSGASGKVVIAGSSSVTPVVEKLSEAYQKINSDVEIEIQESDSTTGMTAAIEGSCDIGMASRELEESEIEAGLKNTVIAMDGIAVIVNKENPVETMSKEEVKSIFTGRTLEWSEILGS